MVSEFGIESGPADQGVVEVEEETLNPSIFSRRVTDSRTPLSNDRDMVETLPILPRISIVHTSQPNKNYF